MDWFTGIVAYIVIWWTALFTVLPWGIVRDENAPTGAPVDPKLKKKFLITTIVAAVLWLVIFLLIKADIIDFRRIGAAMFLEDTGS